ncbi:MAG: DNA translocase FtsK, partial [Chitinophagales bacterium]|nr:DNA translocase FtsK [Chitinophagales bacterium]
MAKTKTTQAKKNTSNEEDRLPSFFTIDRMKRFGGLFLLFFSVFLMIAFISYLFSWKLDQGKIANLGWRLIFSSLSEVNNAMGRLGAFLSHVFIYTFFGIGSFILPFWFFTLGVNSTFQRKLFPTLKITFYTTLFLLMIPLTAQYIFSQSGFSFGGGMGRMLYGWLSTLLGRWGLGILLFGGYATYVLYKFRKSISTAWTNYQAGRQKEKAERERIGGESIIPEEREMPTPHFEDDSYDVLNDEKEEDKELSPYEEPEEIIFETKVVEEDTSASSNELFTIHHTEGENNDEVSLEVEKPKEETISETTRVREGNLYDHTLELSRYQFPPIELLDDHGNGNISIDKDELESNKDQIVETLKNYKISIEKIKATVGPTVTLYEIVPSPGVRISKIKNLEDDIALSLAALGIRIIAPIPGKGTIGIEVPNVRKAVVSMRSMIKSDRFQNANMDLPIAIGKTITNENYIADLAKMPHLLMAGATGQGKSVGLNAILVSLLYKKHPSELKFVLVDPKKVELTLYSKIEKYYLAKLPGDEDAIITDTQKVIKTLNSLTEEMDQRYDLLKMAMVRNIKEYNQKFTERKLSPLKGHRFLPYIVLVIDEFADLMMTAGKDVETPIARMAQLARAIGIHLVIATQRPSVNIITGSIKANFPGRLAFKVAQKIDSRTILDTGGADQLIGRGDLLLSLNSDIIRLQCPFVDTPEIENITTF